MTDVSNRVVRNLALPHRTLVQRHTLAEIRCSLYAWLSYCGLHADLVSYPPRDAQLGIELVGPSGGGAL
jgi:hypothetical protein